MTEQNRNINIETMPIEKAREAVERVELARRLSMATGVVTPESRTVTGDERMQLPKPGKKARRTGITAGIIGIAGVSLLTGALIFGGKTGPDGTMPSPMPSASAAAGNPSPEGTSSPERTSSPDANGFVAKETNTKDGWYRTTIELSDGSKLEVDELDYDPTSMSDGRAVDKGAVMGGDGNIDGEFKSDSLKTSGQATLIDKQDAIVSGKYGYTVYENFDPSKTDSLMQTISTNMKVDGCGLPTGCKTVMLKVYKEDGTLVDYKNGSPSIPEQPSAAPSANPAETQHPADCQCTTVCCQVVVPSCAPTETTTPPPSETPVSPEITCADGYDNELDNIYLGNLAKLKADVANGKNKEYLEVVKPGEKVAVQGDVIVLVDGKLIRNFDSKSSTGALTYVSVPEGKNKKAVIIYIIYGGDVHRMASCTTDAEAETLVDSYVSAMEGTYGSGNVKKYDVK